MIFQILSPLMFVLWIWSEWRSRQQLNRLIICPSFGCLTRQGLSIQWKGLERRANQSIIFIDLDKMHQLNETHGYQEIDRKIKSVCVQLGGQIGRWYSGDEFLLKCGSDDAIPFAQRVERLFKDQGIGATWAIANISGSTFDRAVAIASGEVQAIKLAR